jgi:hypothetical protein
MMSMKELRDEYQINKEQNPKDESRTLKSAKFVCCSRLYLLIQTGLIYRVLANLSPRV